MHYVNLYLLCMFLMGITGVSAKPIETVGFQGDFLPTKWQMGSNPQKNLIITSNAPQSITLQNYKPWAVSGSAMTFLKAPWDGQVEFSYTLTGVTSSCPATYKNDEISTILNKGGPPIKFNVSKGKSFGFALNGQATPQSFGCISNGSQITFSITSFTFTPEQPSFFNAQAYQVPFDAPTPVKDPSTQQTALATFAWQEFIALNWPSSYTTGTPTRGQPDTSKSLGQFAQPDSAGELVWQTYKHRVEVYPKGAPLHETGQEISYNTVPSYNYPSNISVDNNPDNKVPQCGDYRAATGTWAVNHDVTLSSTNIFNNLDETSEIDLATMFTDGDPNAPGIAPPNTTPNFYELPKQPRRFIYEAKANQVMFDYIQKNNFQQDATRLEAQQASYTAVRDDGKGGIAPCPNDNSIICFPPGVSAKANNAGKEGTILVKATWRQLTRLEANSGRFLMAPIIRYRNPDPSNAQAFCFETVKVPSLPIPTTVTSPLPYGLIGLHIIHKTTNYPTFVFATFEQVDTLNSGTPNSSLFYYNRQVEEGSEPLKQTVTARAHPISSATNAVTDEVHFQLRSLLAKDKAGPQDSVWLYYKLIGVQGAATNPTNTEGSDYFLANLVTETNEILRSFSGTLDAKNGTIDPKNPNIQVGHTSYTGGGCKGCHGNAQVGPIQQQGAAPLSADKKIASDFSFITQNAPFGGIPDAINQPLKADDN